MAEQNNIIMPKKLAAKMMGTKESEVSGDTIADVLDIIQQHFTSGGGSGITIVSAELNMDGQSKIDNGVITMSDGSTVDIVMTYIDSLTVTSAEGSATSKAVITVEPPLSSGNHYRYKLGSVTIPAKHEDVGDWLAWDGKSEIAADSGEKLTLVECTSDDKAIRCGTVEVVAPLF